MNRPNSNSLKPFFQAAFSVDVVLFSFVEDNLKVLLVPKDEAPFTGQLGLPGKLISPDEDTLEAVDDLMQKCIHLSPTYITSVGARSDVDRHPNGRVVTMMFYALISSEKIETSLLNKLQFVSLEEIEKLPYDHNIILQRAQNKLRGDLLQNPIVFEVLPQEFIISEMMKVYSQAFEVEVDSPNFRKQIRESNALLPLGRFRTGKKKMGRPAELYSFNREEYNHETKPQVRFNF